MYEFLFPHTVSNTFLSPVFTDCHPHRCELDSHCGLLYISLIGVDVAVFTVFTDRLLFAYLLLKHCCLVPSSGQNHTVFPCYWVVCAGCVFGY